MNARPAAAGSPPGRPGSDRRLSRDDRRDALLDTAVALLEAGGAAAVTMDAVATRAGVSRPLVYKHFPNRDELLVALFRRESAAFDIEVNEALRGVEGLDAVMRASAQAIIDGFARRRRVLRHLLHGDSIDVGLRQAQQDRSRRNHRFYRDLVVAERGLPPEDADALVTMFFGGLGALIAAAGRQPGADERRRMVDVFVAMVMGGLDRLAPPA